jgi:D-alanine transaminase
MSLSVSVSRNGILIPSAQACVSVFNPAIYGAYGVYESMQVVNGAAFEQAAHLRRLAHSAGILGLPLPAGPAKIESWIAEVIAANNVTYEDATYTLRLFVIGPDNGGEVVAYIWPQPHPVYPEDYYTLGAPAITFEGYRYLPQAKSLNALASYMAQRQARATGAHEALLYHDGCLTEGSNSNLFAVVDGTIVTPPAREVLSGVTRDIVIPLAAGGGIPLAEAPLPLAELPHWDECFITSTSRHVMPVTAIDGRPVGTGHVGSITRRLTGLFESYFAKHTARA